MVSMERIREIARECEKDVIELRRWFHAHPEVAWTESGTTDKIAEELGKLGIKVVHRGYGGTDSGLIADIEGAKPGKCIMLRADIDALPVTEENEISYKSVCDGVMHACGHDCHAASLLGAAMILTKLRGEFSGKVRLLFQPAEECPGKSGAKAMLEGGALEGVDAAFGMHVGSSYKSGVAMYRSGPMMAAADSWYLTIEGKGGHGSAPELTVDPTIAAFQIGNAFQSIVAREVSPKDTAVLSVGNIETSSHAFNIIPERVQIDGTVRTFRPEVQDTVQAAMERIVELVGKACRCKTTLNYNRSIPATANDPEMTKLVVKTAQELLGAENAQECDLIMGSEDFSYFCQKVPAAYVHFGTANDDPGTQNSHHSAMFNIDETQLKNCAALYAAFAMNYLG